MPNRIDLEAAHPLAEVQTDKDTAKVLPCANCQTELIVSAFYAAANAKCAGCKGIAGPGMGGVVTPGKTDPRDARDLTDCLINPAFGAMVCPVDAEHGAMELKAVSHNPRYGPAILIGYERGKALYKNSTGETVMLQCNSCKCTASISTTAQSVFKRINEVSSRKHVNGWADPSLGCGVREDAA